MFRNHIQHSPHTSVALKIIDIYHNNDDDNDDNDDTCDDVDDNDGDDDHDDHNDVRCLEVVAGIGT